MNRIREKIGSRKVTLVILLVSIVVFSVIYAFVQTRTGLAILTTPPPGIPGPYYVTAEAKIYGPVVDLAAIKSKMGGTYASDYTYVQWGTNPFYRVYVDNTLQEVYYGQMVDVMEKLSHGFTIENNLKNTHYNLKNVGAVDPTSDLGLVYYFGNMPGVFVVVSDLFSSPSTMNVTTSRWYATEGESPYDGDYWLGDDAWEVRLNGTLCLDLPETWEGISGSASINATGSSEDYYVWNIARRLSYGVMGNNMFAGAFYFQDILSMDTTMPASAYKIYTVIDSPGTGFVSKSVSPASPVTGSTVNILAKFDPPAANNVNLTDLYPNTFGWTGGQVTLEKYRVGAGLVASTSLSVTPTPSGSNMKISITYDQAPSVLQSLVSDEYVYMTYSITAPSVSGEYTLPSATMTYFIPLPQL